MDITRPITTTNYIGHDIGSRCAGHDHCRRGSSCLVVINSPKPDPYADLGSQYRDIQDASLYSNGLDIADWYYMDYRAYKYVNTHSEHSWNYNEPDRKLGYCVKHYRGNRGKESDNGLMNVRVGEYCYEGGLPCCINDEDCYCEVTEDSIANPKMLRMRPPYEQFRTLIDIPVKVDTVKYGVCKTYPGQPEPLQANKRSMAPEEAYNKKGWGCTESGLCGVDRIAGTVTHCGKHLWNGKFQRIHDATGTCVAQADPKKECYNSKTGLFKMCGVDEWCPVHDVEYFSPADGSTYDPYSPVDGPMIVRNCENLGFEGDRCNVFGECANGFDCYEDESSGRIAYDNNGICLGSGHRGKSCRPSKENPCDAGLWCIEQVTGYGRVGRSLCQEPRGTYEPCGGIETNCIEYSSSLCTHGVCTIGRDYQYKKYNMDDILATRHHNAPMPRNKLYIEYAPVWHTTEETMAYLADRNHGTFVQSTTTDTPDMLPYSAQPTVTFSYADTTIASQEPIYIPYIDGSNLSYFSQLGFYMQSRMSPEALAEYDVLANPYKYDGVDLTSDVEIMIRFIKVNRVRGITPPTLPTTQVSIIDMVQSMGQEVMSTELTAQETTINGENVEIEDTTIMPITTVPDAELDTTYSVDSEPYGLLAIR